MPGLTAILTGDLIGSTKAEPAQVEQAMDVLAATAGEISRWQADDAETRFTRFRGDGWQMMLAEPQLALRAAIVIMARLRAAKGGIETRLAIGFGRLDHPGTDDLSDARGTALERSGRTLDAMKRADRMAIDGLAHLALHRIILELLDERISRWTPEQAEAAADYLPPDNPTLAEIAGKLGISPQAVSYRLGGGGASRLRQALRDWEGEVALADEDQP